MSSALSNQSFVHDGAGYDEMFSSGQKDPDISSEERNPSATSPSLRDGVWRWIGQKMFLVTV